MKNTRPTEMETPRHQGDMRTSDTRDDTHLTAPHQNCKPEIDLASWSALGKPSRDRRQKRTWTRRAAR